MWVLTIGLKIKLKRLRKVRVGVGLQCDPRVLALVVILSSTDP